MKYVSIAIIVLAVLGGAYWYGSYAGWFVPGPDNLPTAEERERMREIERIAGTQDPNAKAGVGVAAPGTLPPPPPPVEEATSTATTTDTAASSTEETPSTADNAVSEDTAPTQTP